MKKHPYIKEDRIIIGPKFIGEKDRSLMLCDVQQFLASTQVYQKMVLQISIMKESIKEIPQKNVNEILNDMSFHCNMVEEIMSTLKEYMP